MSRGAFRARVEAPRPAAAWILVSVARATLWITEQLAPWAVAAQVLAILVSLWRRERPFAWQKSPVSLNVGMLGITLATTAVALRGEPTTIALAHFAALTQGLQLLDARPRRTEFLLVALALFQVVLSSNLTDSLLFTPLLVAFVLAAVWTLLVHTLRSEAIEAGSGATVTSALTPGLLRMTLIATGLSVALALVFFISLPRLRSSMVTGASLGPALATAGFSDRVVLGELGRIRQDPTVVLRVDTLEGDPGPGDAYWRGLAFDHFDGATWSITPSTRRLVPGSAEGGVSLGSAPERVNVVQRIVREPVDSGVLFGLGDIRRLQGTVRRLERDTSGGLYAAGQARDRVRYEVASLDTRPDPVELARDRALPPRRDGDRYLQLPESQADFAPLAREITREATSDAERVHLVERHLLENGRYTDVPPSLAGDASPLESFLRGELAGHCEYFASSMVVLVRSLGLPARLVNGFAGGRENRIGRFLELSRSDAHAWVEVHFEEAGWVRFDPTPPDLRVRAAADLSFRERLRELRSAVELAWLRIVGFDRSDQVQVLKRAWAALRDARDARQRARERPAGALARWKIASEWPLGRALGVAALAAAATAVAWRAVRRRRRHAPSPSYAAALRLLARRGLVRSPSTTARQFARRVAAALPGEPARHFSALTGSYLAERFGGHPAPHAPTQLAALRASLGGRRPRVQGAP